MRSIVLGSLVLTAFAVFLQSCDAVPPTDPADSMSGNRGLVAKWTTTEVAGLQTNVVLTANEGGRDMTLACGATNLDETHPAIVKDRTTNTGERQFRTRSSFDTYYFHIFYSDTGELVERHYGSASGHFTVLEDRDYPPKYLYKIKIKGSGEDASGRLFLDCQRDYDAERTPQEVYRIVVSDRCWEEPAGNTILPCHGG